MIFQETSIPGLLLIEPEEIHDERGFFARTFCTEEFGTHHLPIAFAQCNISFNHKKGTLRGMHFQKEPHQELKIVRCTLGAIWDVVIDLRPGSSTFGKHAAFELSQDNRRQLVIPEGLAHGFQTLRDHTEVYYQMSVPFAPGFGAGVRYNDPAFGIVWPLPVSVISDRDAAYPDFNGTVS
jgi:dTDP-4-dehydrorhamnose 3,5-epimerase